MYQFRPFLNSDPPHLAEIWRSQPSQRGLMQPMSAGLLEQFVFAKPYFEREGLIVATNEGRPVGFVHAGFGSNEEGSALSTDAGTTYVLMLHSEHRESSLADELLARSEAYLRGRGSTVIYGGGIRPLNAFYLGLYGGSELPGVLASDTMLTEACRRNGYREINQVPVMRLELGRFRMPVTRDQRRLKRSVVINERYAPPIADWWDACTVGMFDRLDFLMQGAANCDPLASVSFWDIEPLSTGWGLPTAGMFDLQVTNASRRQGIATYMLSEAFSRLRNRGIILVEAQTMQTNTPALAMYSKLGFDTIDRGIVFRKGE